MNKFRMIAAFWLVFLLGFSGGLFVYYTKVWPYGTLKEIERFVRGHLSEDLSLVEKIKNDLDFKPSRHIKVADKGSGKLLTFKEDLVSATHGELTGLSLNPRRTNPKIFVSQSAPAGFRVIYGVFDFKEGLHGAVMLDPKGRVAHVWHTSQKSMDVESPKDTNVFPHGFEIAPDGSIVTAYDEGNTLTKHDYCGNVVWQLDGKFHHSIHFDGKDAIWVWKTVTLEPFWQNNLVKIDYHTGKIIREIPMEKIVEANPNIDIFGILQTTHAHGCTWMTDPWHPNDIEPLPEKWRSHYPEFNAGDLLVSLRNLDLIFVMDADSLKVKWWRQGLVRRQHDADWNDHGTITVFNNNMHRGFSAITEINPLNYESRIIVDGEKYDFYTWWRGKHEMMPDGGCLIASPDQGRVFEVDKQGNIRFEFYNRYSNDGQYLAISEARFLPEDFFKDLPSCNIAGYPCMTKGIKISASD